MKLDVKAFALSCGLIWGVGLFLVTWWIVANSAKGRSGLMKMAAFFGRHPRPVHARGAGQRAVVHPCGGAGTAVPTVQVIRSRNPRRTLSSRKW